MKNLKVIKIDIPIYECDLFILVGSINKAQEWCNNHDMDVDIINHHTTANGQAFGKGSIYGIWLDQFDWSIPDMKILIHEMVHIAVNMMGSVGIPIDQHNHEAFAYLYEYIFAEAFNSLKPKKRRSR